MKVISAEVPKPHRLLQPAESPPDWQQGIPPRHAVLQRQLRELPPEHRAVESHCSLCAQCHCSTNTTCAAATTVTRRGSRQAPCPLCIHCQANTCRYASTLSLLLCQGVTKRDRIKAQQCFGMSCCLSLFLELIQQALGLKWKQRQSNRRLCMHSHMLYIVMLTSYKRHAVHIQRHDRSRMHDRSRNIHKDVLC